MSWRPCVCSACNTHIGWYFQSPEKDFVGLVIDNLISEDCLFFLFLFKIFCHFLQGIF
ncbi:unnamed protein product [Meloidogyne enterolobii]|uniref:Uncharacterized protein n=2 Tax=Meloidogyne enterolobii TaxID=390850 RepID=A0ACB1A4Z8_MELEN